MKVIYVSTVVSKEKNNYLVNNCKVVPLQSIQKFNYLLCEGLTQNDISVKTFSAIPMSKTISNKKIWFERKEIENNIEFNYLPFVNIKIIRQLFLFLFTIVFFLKETLFENNEDKIFICDALNTTISNTCLLLCKFFGIKVVGTFTDLPKDMGGDKINRKINIFFQSKYDAYILLTKYMNDIVNPKSKPFILLEGICDSEILTEKFISFDKRKNKFIYAGGLHERYGVKYMIEAFLELKQENVELHLYGTGDLSEWIKTIKDKRIFYHGSVSNKEVMIAEQSALLLINPRYTAGDYTKYSFPSKNMEYMSTGTPLLTTKLSGIPDEYFDYTYLIEKETKLGIKKDFEKVLSKSKDTLEKFGKRAKEFVTDKKNKVVQGKKLKKFIDNDVLKKSDVKTLKESKLFQGYLVLYLLLSVFLSRNTLYTSIYLGFGLSFFVLVMFSFPILVVYIKKLLNYKYNIGYFHLILLLILLIIISRLFKSDFALYNVTNIFSIMMAFCYSQLIDFKKFKNIFIVIMMILCITSIINLHLMTPLLKSNALYLEFFESKFFVKNSMDVPFINFLTSFVVWLPNYNRNFSIFTEPSFFQFYILMATMFLMYSNYKFIYKIIGIAIFGITMLTTVSTSGLIIFTLLLISFVISYLKQIKSKKKTQIFVIALICTLFIVLKSNYFNVILDGIIYKLFVPNQSIDARTSSIKLAFDSFILHPIFGNNITRYLSTMDITNTLPSIYAIYGLNVGLIITYIFIKFANNLGKNIFDKIIILLALLLSTTSHIFLGVSSFWLILFSISLGKDDSGENTLDC